MENNQIRDAAEVPLSHVVVPSPTLLYDEMEGLTAAVDANHHSGVSWLLFRDSDQEIPVFRKSSQSWDSGEISVKEGLRLDVLPAVSSSCG